MIRSWIDLDSVKKRLRPVSPAAARFIETPGRLARNACSAVTVHPVYVLFFVLEDLPVQLVDQRVNSRVHILIFCLCVDLTTDDMQGGFGHLTYFLNFQRHLTVTDVVKVTLKLLELGVNVILQCGGQFYVMA